MIDRTPQEQSGPLVPPSVRLPEITAKAVALSVALSIILAGANAYLGLFAGMTVSASIPAAVVSLAVLRLFRKSNILENNIVQTAASAGEALAAGVIFTIPALILIKHWTTFDYWQTTAIATVGGLLGVVFTIPLRRALIEGARLRFPEGVATAEVLKVGRHGLEQESASEAPRAAEGFRTLGVAALAGGAVKLADSGLRLWSDVLEGAFSVGRSVFFAGMNLSPALIAVGFIIGFNTAAVVFVGGLVGWFILLPIFAVMAEPTTDLSAMETAKAIWSGQIRFVGIGGMLVGGVWTVIQLRGPVLMSLRRLAEGYRISRARAGTGDSSIPRTERDASLPWIVFLFVGSTLAMLYLYRTVVGEGLVAIVMTAVMVVAAFLFSAVAAYMSGLVGSSSNPISGVTIATIMLAALLLVAIMGHGHPAGPAAALLIGAVVCCAAAMGGDNLQDLKTGHLVGATPWKQQVMQVIGVLAAAAVIAPLLTLLQAKYGIGEVTAEHPNPLAAPQATLMASLAQGVFGKDLPWPLVALGGAFGIIAIVTDRILERRHSSVRFPVLAVALGFYLPIQLSMAVLAGGVLAGLVGRASKGRNTGNNGLLCAAGLITGEALMGILLAVPIAFTGIWPSLGTDPLQIFADPPLGPWPGVVVIGIVAYLLYRNSIPKVPYSQMNRTED